jgi:tRNA threonylcarbamoyladenosine modification (KEOPS) complex Cgi121 subunit
MSPLPPPEARTLWAVGARRARAGVPEPGELVRRLREASQGQEALVALLDARGVAGERHLLSAWAHLGRARARGEVRLRDRGAEFLLFVAGDDQLPRALQKVGVGADTEEFVLVGERPREPAALLEHFGLTADPSVYPRPIPVALLDRIGITPEDRSAVPESAWEGLVLERVALVEMTAAKSAPPSGGGAPAHHHGGTGPAKKD